MVVGHDWGGLLAWQAAASYSARVRSLTVLATPHPDAFFEAIEHDEDQKRRSQYMNFFQLPGGAAEAYFAADDWQFVKRVYQGKVDAGTVESNVRRFSEPGALTAALNWYRALDTRVRIGQVSVPTLYMWGSEDMAVGETAARGTRQYVSGEFHFECLSGKSHWLVDEVPGWIAARTVQHCQLQR